MFGKGDVVKTRMLVPMLLCALPYLLCACATAGKGAATTSPAPAVDPEAQARREQYDKDFGRFYYLEEQGFKEVSCRIVSPTADKMLQSARGMLAPVADKIAVKDTLADYGLTYGVDSGLRIEDPNADIVIKPGTKSADPARTEQGRAQFQNGFKTMILGIDSEIRSVFGIITKSDRNDLDVLYVTDTPDGFDTGYADKKSNAQGSFSLAADTGTMKMSLPTGGSVTAVEHFAPTVGQKLLLQDMEEDLEQSGTKVNTNLAVAYQNLGPVRFPKKISIKSSLDTLQTAHMDVAFDILLTDCNLK